MWASLLALSMAALCQFIDTSQSVLPTGTSVGQFPTYRQKWRPYPAVSPFQPRSMLAPAPKNPSTYTAIDASALDPTYTGPPLRWKSVTRPGLRPRKFPAPPPPSIIMDQWDAKNFVGGPVSFYASIVNDFKDPPAGFAQIIKPGTFKDPHWKPKKWWKKHKISPYERKKADQIYNAPLFPAPVRREPPVGETVNVTLGEAIPFILCHRFTIRIPLMPIWIRTRHHYQICDKGPAGMPIVLFPATRLRE